MQKEGPEVRFGKRLSKNREQDKRHISLQEGVEAARLVFDLRGSKRGWGEYHDEDVSLAQLPLDDLVTQPGGRGILSVKDICASGPQRLRELIAEGLVLCGAAQVDAHVSGSPLRSLCVCR